MFGLSFVAIGQINRWWRLQKVFCRYWKHFGVKFRTLKSPNGLHQSKNRVCTSPWPQHVINPRHVLPRKLDAISLVLNFLSTPGKCLKLLGSVKKKWKGVFHFHGQWVRWHHQSILACEASLPRKLIRQRQPYASKSELRGRPELKKSQSSVNLRNSLFYCRVSYTKSLSPRPVHIIYVLHVIPVPRCKPPGSSSPHCQLINLRFFTFKNICSTPVGKW